MTNIKETDITLRKVKTGRMMLSPQLMSLSINLNGHIFVVREVNGQFPKRSRRLSIIKKLHKKYPIGTKIKDKTISI